MDASEVTSASAPRAEQNAGHWGTFPKGLRVLVVDDDPLTLKVVEQMLRRCDYQVATCTGALAALEMLRDKTQEFDLVLSDVMMAEMDGFKLLEIIGLEMELPVIMMSSDGATQTVLRGVTHGAVDFLIKPVRIEELRNIWQHVIRKRTQTGLGRDVDMDDGVAVKEEDSEFSKKRKELNRDGSMGSDLGDESSSKKARVVWSVEMHQQFVGAVNQLGIDKAVPKKILEIMNVEGLTRENVASHLQKYRLYLKRVQGVTAGGRGIKHGGFGPLASPQNLGPLSPGGSLLTSGSQPVGGSMPGSPPPQSVAALAAQQLQHASSGGSNGGGGGSGDTQQLLATMMSAGGLGPLGVGGLNALASNMLGGMNLGPRGPPAGGMGPGGIPGLPNINQPPGMLGAGGGSGGLLPNGGNNGMLQGMLQGMPGGGPLLNPQMAAALAAHMQQSGMGMGSNMGMAQLPGQMAGGNSPGMLPGGADAAMMGSLMAHMAQFQAMGPQHSPAQGMGPPFGMSGAPHSLPPHLPPHMPHHLHPQHHHHPGYSGEGGPPHGGPEPAHFNSMFDDIPSGPNLTSGANVVTSANQHEPRPDQAGMDEFLDFFLKG